MIILLFVSQEVFIKKIYAFQYLACLFQLEENPKKVLDLIQFLHIHLWV